MKLVCAPQTSDYNLRKLYNLTSEDELPYILVNIWNMTNLKIDVNCLPYKMIKTNFGEFLIRREEFKTNQHLLKYVGKHFVFIHQNTRKVIPLCSHSP